MKEMNGTDEEFFEHNYTALKFSESFYVPSWMIYGITKACHSWRLSLTCNVSGMTRILKVVSKMAFDQRLDV